MYDSNTLDASQMPSAMVYSESDPAALENYENNLTQSIQNSGNWMNNINQTVAEQNAKDDQIASLGATVLGKINPNTISNITDKVGNTFNKIFKPKNLSVPPMATTSGLPVGVGAPTGPGPGIGPMNAPSVPGIDAVSNIAQGSKVGNFLKSGAGMGLLSMGVGLGGKALMGHDKDPSVFTKKEKWGAALSGAGDWAGKVSSFGNPLLTLGAGIAGGIFGRRKGQKQADMYAKGDRANRANISNAMNNVIQQQTLNKEYSGEDVGYGKLGGMNMYNMGGMSGGYTMPLPNGGQQYFGKTHEQGGIKIDDGNAEVEGGGITESGKYKPGETSTDLGNGGEYIFSDHLKTGGDTYAEVHKELLMNGGNKEDEILLAQQQEEQADRPPLFNMHAGGLYHNINHTRKSGKSNSKSNSTISDKSYRKMQRGFKEMGGPLMYEDGGPSRWSQFLDKAQTGLTVAGLTPAVGAIPDLLNTAISGVRTATNTVGAILPDFIGNRDFSDAGRHLANTGLNLATAVPALGQGVAGGKLTVQGLKQLNAVKKSKNLTTALANSDNIIKPINNALKGDPKYIGKVLSKGTNLDQKFNDGNITNPMTQGASDFAASGFDPNTFGQQQQYAENMNDMSVDPDAYNFSSTLKMGGQYKPGGLRRYAYGGLQNPLEGMGEQMNMSSEVPLPSPQPPAFQYGAQTQQQQMPFKKGGYYDHGGPHNLPVASEVNFPPDQGDIPAMQGSFDYNGMKMFGDTDLQKYISKSEDFGTEFMSNADPAVLAAAGITSFSDFGDPTKTEAYQNAWNKANPDNLIEVDSNLGEQTIRTGINQQGDGENKGQYYEWFGDDDDNDGIPNTVDARNVATVQGCPCEDGSMNVSCCEEKEDLKVKKKFPWESLLTAGVAGLQLIPAIKAIRDTPDYMPGPPRVGRTQLDTVRLDDARENLANSTNALNKSIETSGLGPASIIAKMATYDKKADKSLKIGAEEKRLNIGINNQEAKMNQYTDMFNTKNLLKVSEFNTAADATTKDRKLAGWQALASNARGLLNDFKSYRGEERLGKVIGGDSGTYDRQNLKELYARQNDSFKENTTYDQFLEQYQPTISEEGGFINNNDMKKLMNGGRNYRNVMRKGGFPDLTGDGKVTRADILKGRGVFAHGGIHPPATNARLGLSVPTMGGFFSNNRMNERIAGRMGMEQEMPPVMGEMGGQMPSMYGMGGRYYEMGGKMPYEMGGFYSSSKTKRKLKRR